MSQSSETLREIAEEITLFLRHTLDDLAWVNGEMQTLLQRTALRDAAPTRVDVENIRESLKRCLTHPEHPMDRVGVATSVGFLSDQPYWMDWWGMDGRGNPEFVGHSLNPQGDVFYDYSRRSWFSNPWGNGTAAATGPFVDYGGFNSYTYTVTVSIPLSSASGVIGVAGADILVDRFEGFMHQATKRQTTVVLANTDLRVIASNTGAHLPGELLDPARIAPWRDYEFASELFPASGGWHLFAIPS